MQSHHGPQCRRIHKRHIRQIYDGHRIVPSPRDRLELEYALKNKWPPQAKYADPVPRSSTRFDLKFIH